jgi:hypothetical protein
LIFPGFGGVSEPAEKALFKAGLIKAQPCFIQPRLGHFVQPLVLSQPHHVTHIVFAAPIKHLMAAKAAAAAQVGFDLWPGLFEPFIQSRQYGPGMPGHTDAARLQIGHKKPMAAKHIQGRKQ